VFDDAILGEQAAYRAGMQRVGVATTLRAKDFQATLTGINDFTELAHERLQVLFAQAGVVPKPSKELAERQYIQQA
jgi:beta-phosphoglucomutase-like phosphatase (HAD superfamily)